MLAAFCLRLAFGVLAPLLFLPSRLLHPRFFRTQFLIALGLAVVAAMSSIGDGATRISVIIAVCVLTLAGSIVWNLEPAPRGKLILDLSLIALLAGVCRMPFPNADASSLLAALDGITSGLLMGAALTAMLIGHSYLISPGLTMMPLNRMLAWLFGTLAARIALTGVALFLWSHSDTGRTLTDASYWLPVRWLVGFLAPAVFAFMAWLTARIRSTQSATGILYVVVICVFLGELIGMLLLRSTGFPL